MRIVLDSNVVVAAFATRGLCSDLFEVSVKECEIVLSESLLDEINNTLKNKIKLPSAKINSITEFLRQETIMVVPVSLPAASCRDPADVKVLATAVAGSAQVIVTGDEDLLILRNFSNVQILTPRELWSLLTRKKSDQ